MHTVLYCIVVGDRDLLRKIRLTYNVVLLSLFFCFLSFEVAVVLVDFRVGFYLYFALCFFVVLFS